MLMVLSSVSVQCIRIYDELFSIDTVYMYCILSGEEVKFSKQDLHSSSYHIAGADLRNLQDLKQSLQQCDCDKNIPTIFIAECVLVYMSKESSQALASWVAQQFQTCFFINYEQVCEKHIKVLFCPKYTVIICFKSNH